MINIPGYPAVCATAASKLHCTICTVLQHSTILMAKCNFVFDRQFLVIIGCSIQHTVWKGEHLGGHLGIDR